LPAKYLLKVQASSQLFGALAAKRSVEKITFQFG
jgi:hypothetical protein